MFDINESSNVESHPLYKEATQFCDKFQVNPDVSYDWIYELSQKQRVESERDIRILETKADGLIKYTISGLTLLGAAFTYLLTYTNIFAQLGLLVGIVLIVLSLISASRALSPTKKAGDRLPADMLADTERCKDKNELLGVSAAVLHIAIVDNALNSQIKSRYVAKAYKWVLIAVTWLAIVLPISVFFGNGFERFICRCLIGF